MKNNRLFTILLITLFTAIGISACNNNDNDTLPQFITDAQLQEAGQTLSPGEKIHLLGNGYQKDDEVILNFFWETGDPNFPTGYLKMYRAQITSFAGNGITIVLPNRKPESDVEIMLHRGGEMQLIGKIHLKDGTTPADIRLYGIIHNKTITRCPFNNSGYDSHEWSVADYPDFHSVVSCWQCYGICGLSKKEGKQFPCFFDLYTSEWKQLNDLSTLSLFSGTAFVGALQSNDGIHYFANIISDELEKCNYQTTTPKSVPNTPQTFPLPENLKAEYFGKYPGAFNGSSTLLFSARTDTGQWYPVLFDIYQGFKVLERIEADELLPFSCITSTQEWLTGYIVVKKDAEKATQIYLLKKGQTDDFFKTPVARYTDCAISVTANYNRPYTITVHFHESEKNNSICEYSFETQQWKEIALSKVPFDEIVWTN